MGVGVGGCTYCINESFSPNVKETHITIKEQIEKGKAFHKKRCGAEKFIAYFQSFTNTYADIETLRACYEEALADKDIVGISIGTRRLCHGRYFKPYRQLYEKISRLDRIWASIHT